MKKMMMSVMAAAMMLQGVASASGLFCGNFWVAGEALLLRPSGAYPYAVIRGPALNPDASPVTVPVGDQVAVCPSYEWGYKIELGYRNCDKEILVNWLSFNNSYKNKFAYSDQEQIWEAAGFPGIPLVGPGEYVAGRTFRYDALDAEAAKLVSKECSKFSGRMFVGLRFARIQNNDVTLALRDEFLPDFEFGNRIFARSDFQGVGPRVGLGARWDAWCNFGVTGSVAGHMLIGSAKSEFTNDTVVQVSAEVIELQTKAAVRNHKTCRIIPASEIKFGIDWRPCLFCGLTGEFGVGYQITHYFYGSHSTLFTQNNETAPAGTNHVHTDPVSFDGWYFRIGLGY
jgi:Legionella pneumophila major outer membrane protein precursor